MKQFLKLGYLWDVIDDRSKEYLIGLSKTRTVSWRADKGEWNTKRDSSRNQQNLLKGS